MEQASLMEGMVVGTEGLDITGMVLEEMDMDWVMAYMMMDFKEAVDIIGGIILTVMVVMEVA